MKVEREECGRIEGLGNQLFTYLLIIVESDNNLFLELLNRKGEEDKRMDKGWTERRSVDGGFKAAVLPPGTEVMLTAFNRHMVKSKIVIIITALLAPILVNGLATNVIYDIVVRLQVELGR